MLSTVHLLGNVQHEVKHNVKFCSLWEKYILSFSAVENLYYDHNLSTFH